MDIQHLLPSYDQLLKREEWLHRRKEILDRDRQQCRVCGSSKSLQVHHRQYHISNQTNDFILPWEYNQKYLITLCKSCHEKGHKLYQVPCFTI